MDTVSKGEMCKIMICNSHEFQVSSLIFLNMLQKPDE